MNISSEKESEGERSKHACSKNPGARTLQRLSFFIMC